MLAMVGGMEIDRVRGTTSTRWRILTWAAVRDYGSCNGRTLDDAEIPRTHTCLRTRRDVELGENMAGVRFGSVKADY